jgi:hypothetical protein
MTWSEHLFQTNSHQNSLPHTQRPISHDFSSPMQYQEETALLNRQKQQNQEHYNFLKNKIHFDILYAQNINKRL